jgi:hypothetical protein
MSAETTLPPVGQGFKSTWLHPLDWVLLVLILVEIVYTVVLTF